MAIQDVDDLIKQLRWHPAWRDALRREILTEELLSLHERRLMDKVEAYLLGEVSTGIGLEDVHRAAQRAKILSRATEQPVIPAVGGKSIIPEARELAQELGVAVILDGGLQIA